MAFVMVVVLFALSFAGFVAVRRGVMPRNVNSTLTRHWRKMTWAIVAWVAATVAVLVVGASDTDPYAGAALLTLATMVGSIGLCILIVIWFATRPRRPCPMCGQDPRKVVTMCRKCGYNCASDLVVVAGAAVAPTSSQDRPLPPPAPPLPPSMPS